MVPRPVNTRTAAHHTRRTTRVIRIKWLLATGLPVK